MTENSRVPDRGRTGEQKHGAQERQRDGVVESGVTDLHGPSDDRQNPYRQRAHERDAETRCQVEDQHHAESTENLQHDVGALQAHAERGEERAQLQPGDGVDLVRNRGPHAHERTGVTNEALLHFALVVERVEPRDRRWAGRATLRDQRSGEQDRQRGESRHGRSHARMNIRAARSLIDDDAPGAASLP